MTDQIVVKHSRHCPHLRTNVNACGPNTRLEGLGVKICGQKMAFSDRLRDAARHVGVEWSQTAVAKALGYSKQTVDRWFGTGEPKPAQIFNIADRWKLSPRWLATGEGKMVLGEETDGQARDGREEMMLLLFRGLTPEQQRELVIETNALVTGNREVQTRFLDKPLRTFGNEDVEAAFGKVPRPSPQKRSKPKRRKGFLEEDPE